ncbi:phosphatidylglycerophosphatase B [mine drainage metagenome]|uniref:Phosphatidylglycerophosphatase B n=1 Tax=mine drainage metagenome TaxID=410659 RepID=A0A1J5SP49_9ZZZZ
MKEFLYDWGGANVWLFHAINDIRFEWLDRVMLLGTALGDHNLFTPYLCLLTLIALIMVHRPDQDHQHYRLQVTRWMSVIAVFSVAYLLDGLLLGFLKPLLDFPRPPLALPAGTVNIVGTPEYHHSLPSGHSSFAMLVVASLWPVLQRRWRMAGAVFVLWVGISRSSLGAHFPADVLAGFLSSLAVVLLVYVAVHKLVQLAGRRPGDTD